MTVSSIQIKLSLYLHAQILQKYFRWLSVFIFLTSLPLYAEDIDKKSAELDSVRNQIKEVKTRIEKARLETNSLQIELKKNETSAGYIAFDLRKIEGQLQQGSKLLHELNNKKSLREIALAEHKRALSQQIRSAYMVGKNDYVKLLLNQEDPARVGRALAYYNYQNEARAKQINSVNIKITAITELENRINNENNKLIKRKKNKLTKNQEIAQSRKDREEILAKLLSKLQKQGSELQTLQQQELETKKLLEKLMKGHTKRDLGSVALFEDIPPFNNLRGKLDWPTNGKLLAHFGSNKLGSSLKWQGVIIHAAIGVEVKAISSGQVVFADWFRNLGLLLIIDHGDGYMSLYGYNQSLLKKIGDWVLPGEIIALAGDSGGQLHSGVYFEIRSNGSPVNPTKWCRN